MTALPQGQQRRQYARSTDEIKEATGLEEVREVAPTYRVKGMVVHNPLNASAQQAQEPVAAADVGPNFKAFRKNAVPVPRQASIRFRAVLPKESEHQLELEAQREAIDEQQRRADELFRDQRVPSAGRRRRR